MSHSDSHGTFLHFSLQTYASILKSLPFEYLLLPPRSALQAVPSRRHRQTSPQITRTPSYTTARTQRCRLCIGSVLQRHPFSGPIHSAGELLHTPWRIPTSMATVLLSKWIDTFHGLYMRTHSGTLTQRSVHPASPVLLTKNGPLRVFTHSTFTSKLNTQQDQKLKHPVKNNIIEY